MFAATLDIMPTQPVATLYIVFNLLTCLCLYVVLSISFFALNGAARIRYVRSNANTPCPNTLNPCLTFAEYANETDRYFVRDAIFNFSPGTHDLSVCLKLTNIDHFSFHGLSINGVSTIRFDTNSSIVIENCSHVEISSVTFSLIGKFTYSLVFKHSLFIHLSNISVLGNKNGRYSAIVSLNSGINITDSSFAYMTGTIGAVIMMSKSTAILGGNSFVKNMAVSGGAIYMSDSILVFKSTNVFMNNDAKSTSNRMWTKVIRTLSSGGAIFSHNSSLIQGISSVLHFINNTAEYNSGGAISSSYSHLWFAGNVLFENNTAYTGGAMDVYHTMIYFDGKISFLNNYAIESGGALHIYYSEVSQSGNQLILPFVLFHYNTAACKGGSVQISNSTLLLIGNTIFDSNSARIGGALNVEANFTLLWFDGNVQFLDNNAEIGGALNVLNAIIQFDGSIYFLNNSATMQGGALAIIASVVSFNANNFSVPLFTAAQMPPFQSGNINEQGMAILFYTNSAGTGGAIDSVSSVIKFSGTYDTDCTALKDSPLDAIGSSTNLSMYFTVFFQNKATKGGCINSLQSILHFMGNMLFGKNEAETGGAFNLNNSTSWFTH